MPPIDRAALIASYTRLLDAWNRRNAGDFAAQFATDATAVGFDGSQMNGRDEIASSLRKIFADHPTASYLAKIREVREITDGVALLRSVVGMVPPGSSKIKPAVNAIQSVVFVRKGSDWRIALLQNTPAAFHGRPEVAKELTRELTAVLRTQHTVVDPETTS
jgi:uncharacterized protein (TIGR02246 family)